MTTYEIRDRAISIYDRLAELQEANLGSFVYVPEIDALYKELDELQAQCPHEYDDSGRCNYCAKEK